MQGIKKAWYGRKIWRRLKKKYHINYTKVVIILNENNEEWNQYALLHITDYMKQKSASKAIVIYTENVPYTHIEKYCQKDFYIIKEQEEKILYLNKYYVFARFFDNIVFVSLSYPKDNNANEIIHNGIITKEELICLGFYNLRMIPPLKNGGSFNV